MKSYQTLLLIYCILIPLNQKATCQDKLLDRPITLKVNEASLPEFIRMIEEAEQIKFVYTHNLLPKNYKVNIQVHNRSLNRVLESVLGSTAIRWKDVKGHVVLYANTAAPPPSNTHLINVINVYDTIISVLYDTIRNQVFDTLLILQHDTLYHRDTIVHEIYRSIQPQWEIGASGSIVAWNNYALAIHNSQNSLSNITDQIGFTYSTTASIRLKRNRWLYELGTGMQSYTINRHLQHAQYEPLHKDTTVYYLEEYLTYRQEGNNRIPVTGIRSTDSSYTFAYDSTQYWLNTTDTEKIRYVSVPLVVGINFFRIHHTWLYAKAGGTLNLLLSETPSKHSLPGIDPIEYKRLYYNYVLGLGVEQHIGKRLKIWGDIMSKTSVNPLYINATRYSNLESIIIYLGMSYCLNPSH